MSGNVFVGHYEAGNIQHNGHHSPKESKGGRTVKARLNFLENLAAEFGMGLGWKRMIEFVVSNDIFDRKV